MRVVDFLRTLENNELAYIHRHLGESKVKGPLTILVLAVIIASLYFWCLG